MREMNVLRIYTHSIISSVNITRRKYYSVRKVTGRKNFVLNFTTLKEIIITDVLSGMEDISRARDRLHS